MRRKVWRVVTAASAGLVLGATLTACGGDSGDSDTVTLKFLNYGDWVGETEIADFEAAHPGIEIKQYALPEGGSSALAAQLAKDKGVYDLVAVGNATAARLAAADLLADFDPADVPNLAEVPAQYVEQFPWGVPSNLGKVGILYNRDLVEDPPTTWTQLFDEAEKWSGRIVFPDYDLDVQAIALLALGHDINTTDEDELAEAEAKIKEIKPHLLAFQGTGQAKSVIDGSAVIAVAHDYTYADAADDTLGWISPEEGTPGYIEGVALLPGSDHVEEALEFLDFRLEPETYGGFINNTGSSYLLPQAEEFIDESLLRNPALRHNPDSPFLAEEFVSAEATEARAKMWNRIKAS